MMPRPPHLLMLLLIALLLGSTATTATARQTADLKTPRVASTTETGRAATVPSPREVLGFAPGDDRRLADWPQIVDYFKRLDSASGRVSVHQPGLTTERRPFIVAIISSEENIQNLPRIREAQRKLADPRLIASTEERERLIRTTPAVFPLTPSLFSTENVAPHKAMEVAVRVANRSFTAPKHIYC